MCFLTYRPDACIRLDRLWSQLLEPYEFSLGTSYRTLDCVC